MPRIDQSSQRRQRLLPIVARCFAERGYRRATTAELARRCRVRENVLYRLWPDKKAMFLASIRYVYDHSVEIWMKLLADRGRRASPAERLLDYEAVHHGEFGLYRIVFAGLSETDDADIRSALHDMYARFAGFLEQRIREHRAEGRGTALPADLTAWAVVGLGTVADICRELRRGDAALRRRLLADAGRVLLHGEPS